MSRKMGSFHTLSTLAKSEKLPLIANPNSLGQQWVREDYNVKIGFSRVEEQTELTEVLGSKAKSLW